MSEVDGKEDPYHVDTARELPIVFAVVAAPIVFAMFVAFWDGIAEIGAVRVATGIVAVFLDIVSLSALRHFRTSDTAKAVWCFVVLALPILGALAFFIVNPKDVRNQQNSEP